MSDINRNLSAGAYPLLLASLTAICAYAIAGPSLGLFLGGLLLLAALCPTLAMAEGRPPRQLMALYATLVPFVIVWLFALGRSQAQVREVVPCVIVAIAYGLALVGLSAGLRCVRLSAPLAAGVSVTVGLFWLTWPIWMSRTWNGEDSAASVARVAMIHPAMVVDAQLARAFGPWSELSVAYHLTDLNQNVSYSPPHTTWACVLIHAVIASAGLGVSAFRVRPRSASDTSTAAARVIEPVP
jgi:hypothetical protein